ncbi:MAG: hypothetical protein MJ118_00430 [Clostridia bacterium]|nr:hypothetical protein [Clostridia bacterium]
MREFLCKIFTPWRAGEYFENYDAYCSFLVRCNKICNAVRVVMFAAAAILLFIGYNVTDGGRWSIAAISDQPYYLIAVGVLVAALVVSLVIIENEKQLPKELHMK